MSHCVSIMHENTGNSNQRELQNLMLAKVATKSLLIFSRPIDVGGSAHLHLLSVLVQVLIGCGRTQSQTKREAKQQDSTDHHLASLSRKILSWILSTGDKYCIGEDQTSLRQNSLGHRFIFRALHISFSISLSTVVAGSSSAYDTV